MASDRVKYQSRVHCHLKGFKDKKQSTIAPANIIEVKKIIDNIYCSEDVVL